MKLKLLTLLVIFVVVLNPTESLRVPPVTLKKGTNVTVTKKLNEKDVSCIFTVKKLIGEGGYGKVYKAENNNLKQEDFCSSLPKEVALKIQELKESFQLENAKNEIEILNTLKDSKFVPKLYMTNIDKISFVCDKASDNLYQVIELLAISLHDFIYHFENICPFRKERRIIVRESFKALKQIHSLNILHYDLKLANIMIDQKEKKLILKIIDFGLSKKLTKETSVQTFTNDYFPPEVIKAKDEKIDYMKAEKSMDVVMMGRTMLKLFVDKEKINQVNVTNNQKFRETFGKDLKKLNKKDLEIVNLLIDHSINEKPEVRHSAEMLFNEIDKILQQKNFKSWFSSLKSLMKSFKRRK